MDRKGPNVERHVGYSLMLWLRFGAEDRAEALRSVALLLWSGARRQVMGWLRSYLMLGLLRSDVVRRLRLKMLLLSSDVEMILLHGNMLKLRLDGVELVMLLRLQLLLSMR